MAVKGFSSPTKVSASAILAEKTIDLSNSLDLVKQYSDTALSKLKETTGVDVTNDDALTKAEDKALEAFATVQKEQGADFGGMLQKAQSSAQGLTSTVNDALGSAKGVIEDKAGDAIATASSQAKDLSSLYAKAKTYCDNVGDAPDCLDAQSMLNSIADFFKQALDLGDMDLAEMLMNCMKHLGNDALSLGVDLGKKLAISTAITGNVNLYENLADTVGPSNLKNVTGDLQSVLTNAGDDFIPDDMVRVSTKLLGSPDNVLGISTSGVEKKISSNTVKQLLDKGNINTEKFISGQIGKDATQFAKKFF